MRFPNLEAVALGATLEAISPGQLHRDGRRYLPLIVLRTAQGTQLGVVDRHHRIREADMGRSGVARLIFQLSRLRLQPAGERRQGFERGVQAGVPSLSPATFGTIVAVPTWEQHRKLGYDSLYTELLIDVGEGIVGVRTNVTGGRLADVLGAERLEAGDWVALERSRIDILEFVAGNRPEEQP